MKRKDYHKPAMSVIELRQNYKLLVDSLKVNSNIEDIVFQGSDEIFIGDVR